MSDRITVSEQVEVMLAREWFGFKAIVQAESGELEYWLIASYFLSESKDYAYFGGRAELLESLKTRIIEVWDDEWEYAESTRGESFERIEREERGRLVRFRQWFFHDIMGWHNCKGGNGSFDGCSQHAKCSCGKEVMQDGQGNWF